MRKILAFMVAAALLVPVLMLSAILLSLIVAVGAMVSLYLWWKTRDLRKQMRTQAMDGVIFDDAEIRSYAIKGEIIEGEVMSRGVAGIEHQRNADSIRD